MTQFELWEFRSANLIASVATEAEALALVRELLATGDPGYLSELGLAEIHEDGTDGLVIEGEALVERAMASELVPQCGAA